jgi:hypothetical protein
LSAFHNTADKHKMGGAMILQLAAQLG